MVVNEVAEMILVRTRVATQRVADWADELHRVSGLPAILLTDGRTGHHTLKEPFHGQTLSMTCDQDRTLGLYSPPDAGWRCGDYGYYAARARFSNISHFWMIEDDVRFGGDAGSFFAYFARFPQIDFIASHVNCAEPDWWWYSHALARDVKPWRSFFPVTRLSAHAVDLLHTVRRKHSRQWHRRYLWPNDEAFVATSVIKAGLSYKDLNALGRVFYDTGTFGYERQINPEDVPSNGPVKLFHPVLDAAASMQRLKRIRKAATTLSIPRRFLRLILKLTNRLSRW